MTLTVFNDAIQPAGLQVHGLPTNAPSTNGSRRANTLDPALVKAPVSETNDNSLLFPFANKQVDERCFLIGNIPRPNHRERSRYFLNHSSRSIPRFKKSTQGI